jgi:hypothetical protein
MGKPAVTTLGDWTEQSGDARAQHEMTVDARFLREQWKRCSIAADSWADYLSALVPTDGSAMMSPEDVRSLLSYMLNEMLENTAKFSSGEEQPVEYRAWMEPDSVIVELSNRAEGGQAGRLQNFATTLLEGDPSELYIARMEEAAETGESGSGIGFLTLVMDYGVALAFRFTNRPDGYTSVTVQAQFSLV